MLMMNLAQDPSELINPYPRLPAPDGSGTPAPPNIAPVNRTQQLAISAGKKIAIVTGIGALGGGVIGGVIGSKRDTTSTIVFGLLGVLGGGLGALMIGGPIVTALAVKDA